MYFFEFLVAIVVHLIKFLWVNLYIATVKDCTRKQKVMKRSRLSLAGLFVALCLSLPGQGLSNGVTSLEGR